MEFLFYYIILRIIEIDSKRSAVVVCHEKTSILVDFSIMPKVQFLIGEVYEFIGEIEECDGERICKAFLGETHSGLDIYLIEKSSTIIMQRTLKLNK